MKGTDYFAELYVAGVLARAGWNIFPHRDEAFDFIISKPVGDEMILRPVQVKGKYPQSDKTDRRGYGYIGKLTQLHPEMVLAIPYFSVNSTEKSPDFIAYMPRCQIRRHSRGFRCLPAEFKGGRAKPRRDYSRFFEASGIHLLESKNWKDTPRLRPASESGKREIHAIG